MFYTYSQNNSGGSFDIDHHFGITTYVIVEADSASDADERAEDIGLYFNGAGDCDCCGNRWSPAAGWWDDASDGDSVPSIWGEPVWEYTASNYRTRRTGENKPFVYVHFKDGSFAGVVSGPEDNYAVRPIRQSIYDDWEFLRIENAQLKAIEA
jgi:hypothetical protein